MTEYISLLSNTAIIEIEQWLTKFPKEQRRSAVIPALMVVQKENRGYLTEPLIAAVADYLQIPKIAAMEVASFYSMFELRPVGKHKICVCTNISCMLCGSKSVVAHLQEKLGIGFDQTTPDGMFSLKEVECLAACDGAPAMQIGEKYYDNLTPDKIDVILEGLK